MSNVKEIQVQGTIPFDAHQHGDGWKGWLAEMNTPVFGFRILYLGEPVMVPNNHRGATATYQFNISGAEAVSWDALKDLVSCVKIAGGSIQSAKARDIENNGPWCPIL